jgi:hypothetical protein
MSKSRIYDRLKRHLSTDPAVLPVVQHELPLYERPNLHFAIDELIVNNESSQFALTGIIDFDYGLTLSRLANKSAAKQFAEGPVEFSDIALGNGERQACVKQGLYLFQDDDHPVVLLVVERETYRSMIQLEVIAAQRERSECFLRKLLTLIRSGKAYRGHVLSLQLDCYHNTQINFHSLPRIERTDIILPEQVLRRVERHTIDFSRHIDRLRSSQRHLKRGILLHGLPGTGKTLSAMYLASQMPQRTTLLMTGAGMGSIETACNLARILEPSTVVLEDVDLIGTRRDRQMVDANALLFELLNQMDGLAEDSDILFILTTNRPDILEPALASRPGRIDQAIEIPLPNAECRQRLFNLYSRGLRTTVSNWQPLIERTEGASAAFIRELLRKAAIVAAVERNGDQIVVQERDFDEAITELLVAGGDLTKSLLGASQAHE